MSVVKVCHVGNDNKNKGGAFLITRRVEGEIRQYGYAFDYLTMDEFIETDETEWSLLPGSKAFSCHLRNNRLFGHFLLPFYVYAIFKKNKYKIVHIDTDTAWKALLYAIPSKLSGAKVVVHSHSAGVDGDFKLLKTAMHNICKPILPMFVDKQLACSEKACRWMYPKWSMRKAMVLLNGIDLDRFHYDAKIRSQWRKKLGFTNELILGNVGSICKRKNQEYCVRILGELRRRGIDSVLLLVGGYDYGSDWEKRIMDAAKQEHVEEYTILYGFSENTVELMDAMDVYVCPSLVEGAPLSVYEAQAMGLPCIMSDTVSEDTIVSDWIETENLKSGCKIWCKKIVEMSEKFKRIRTSCKLDERYGLGYMANKLSVVYSELLQLENSTGI